MIRTVNAMSVALACFGAQAAAACECVGYADDAAMVRAENARLASTTAAIVGVVVNVGMLDRSVTVRATRVWFGPKQREYAISIANTCSSLAGARIAETVRVSLTLLPPETGWLARIRHMLAPSRPLYEADFCRSFANAMDVPAMRAAVARRAQQRREQLPSSSP